MDEEESILQEFLVECGEGIGRLDREFVELESDPENAPLIGSIFRTIHTIKGTCGFLGLPKLENVAHGTENILSAMRDKDFPITEEGITTLLDAVDHIKDILEEIEDSGKEPEKDYTPIRAALDTFLASGGAKVPQSDSSAAPLEEKVADLALTEAESQKLAEMTDSVQKVEDETPPETSLTQSKAAPVAPPAKAQEKKKKTKAKGPSLAESSIRVDVKLLDNLINMIGELVLARNQLLQQVREQDQSAASSGTIQQLNLITTELQDTVMKTRMQPIRHVWEKFPRVVRDLARANGKDIELVMEGAETELDRTLLEAIKDPMTHIVRNSADHGIEMPDVRQAHGKPIKGRLLLKAFHEGGQINIEIIDDGAGIDLERVRAKAIEKGVITEEVAAQMSEREVIRLIFHPGLSTAKKVTNVSGRGVGMDVVKTNIEKIGGVVEMSTRLGEGTHMRIKIPLTLAIIPALMVTSGGEPFAIPQASLLELLRVDEKSKLQIEIIRGSKFYRLRGVLLPLVSLNTVLKLEEVNPVCSEDEDSPQSSTDIVVLKSGEHSFGLIVDHVNDSEEVVVKPLSRHLKGLTYLAGATIMGDGRVALILDVSGIAHEGLLLSTERAESKDMSSQIEEDARTDRETMILFSVGENDQYAIPLSKVARLEEFDPEKVEQSAESDVIQYRGELLPLVRLGDTIGVVSADSERDTLPAIVFSKNGKSVGLMVARILDIVEANMNLHASPSGNISVVGSLVVNGLTTDLLDVDQLIDMAVPGWFDEMVEV